MRGVECIAADLVVKSRQVVSLSIGKGGRNVKKFFKDCL